MSDPVESGSPSSRSSRADGAAADGTSHELGIVGAGNMAEAIARGVLGAKLFRPDQLIAADVAPARRELFERELKVRAVDHPADAAHGARRLLLSVKPQQMANV